jgi:hypothetical protein
MTRADLIELEKTLMAEVVKRRSLGGYSAEAEGLMLHAEALLRIVQHLKDKAPRDK